ncbi:hypothetical protein O3P69_017453 [Scylla paramamosain]|uniref:Uncharacterized protein n=1 Tax=Scylla paramamosain TaxID=85552 RepID=A0AAW0TYZ0_SCYPA
MAESLALVDSVEEGMRRGVKKAQDDGHASAKHSGMYDTFERKGDDGCDDADRQRDRKAKRAKGCSPVALLRYVVNAMRPNRLQETRPLTERRATTSIGCSSHITRYLPRLIWSLGSGAAHGVMDAGAWVIEGLKDYAANGGFYLVPVETLGMVQTSPQQWALCGKVQGRRGDVVEVKEWWRQVCKRTTINSGEWRGGAGQAGRGQQEAAIRPSYRAEKGLEGSGVGSDRGQGGRPDKAVRMGQGGLKKTGGGEKWVFVGPGGAAWGGISNITTMEDETGDGGAGRGAGRGPSIGHGGLRVLGQGLAAPRTPAAARRVTAPRRPPPPAPIPAPLAAGEPVVTPDTNASWWKEVNEQVTMRVYPAARRPCVLGRKGEGASPPLTPPQGLSPPERVARFGQCRGPQPLRKNEPRLTGSLLPQGVLPPRPSPASRAPSTPSPDCFPHLPPPPAFNASPTPPPPGHQRHAPARKFQWVTFTLMSRSCPARAPPRPWAPRGGQDTGTFSAGTVPRVYGLWRLRCYSADGPRGGTTTATTTVGLPVNNEKAGTPQYDPHNFHSPPTAVDESHFFIPSVPVHLDEGSPEAAGSGYTSGATPPAGALLLLLLLSSSSYFTRLDHSLALRGVDRSKTKRSSRCRI